MDNNKIYYNDVRYDIDVIFNDINGEPLHLYSVFIKDIIEDVNYVNQRFPVRILKISVPEILGTLILDSVNENEGILDVTISIKDITKTSLSEDDPDSLIDINETIELKFKALLNKEYRSFSKIGIDNNIIKGIQEKLGNDLLDDDSLGDANKEYILYSLNAIVSDDVIAHVNLEFGLFDPNIINSSNNKENGFINLFNAQNVKTELSIIHAFSETLNGDLKLLYSSPDVDTINNVTLGGPMGFEQFMSFIQDNYNVYKYGYNIFRDGGIVFIMSKGSDINIKIDNPNDNQYLKTDIIDIQGNDNTFNFDGNNVFMNKEVKKGEPSVYDIQLAMSNIDITYPIKYVGDISETYFNDKELIKSNTDETCSISNSFLKVFNGGGSYDLPKHKIYTINNIPEYISLSPLTIINYTTPDKLKLTKLRLIGYSRVMIPGSGIIRCKLKCIPMET